MPTIKGKSQRNALPIDEDDLYALTSTPMPIQRVMTADLLKIEPYSKLRYRLLESGIAGELYRKAQRVWVTDEEVYQVFSEKAPERCLPLVRKTIGIQIPDDVREPVRMVGFSGLGRPGTLKDKDVFYHIDPKDAAHYAIADPSWAARGFSEIHIGFAHNFFLNRSHPIFRYDDISVHLGARLDDMSKRHSGPTIKFTNFKF